MSRWQSIAGCVAALTVVSAAPLASQVSIASATLARERSGAGIASNDTVREVAQPATSLEAALQAAFADAGVIFTGEVVSIERTPGAVVIRWRVEDAVAGVSVGAIYPQREWPGLWADGNARYRVGERALVLLHSASVGGYASPVADGIIPLRGDTIAGTLDLRWVAQHVAVTDAASLQPMLAVRAAGGDLALADALLKRSGTASNVAQAHGPLRLPATPGSQSDGGTMSLSPVIAPSVDDAHAHVDGAMILGMLHAWQRTKAAGQ